MFNPEGHEGADVLSPKEQKLSEVEKRLKELEAWGKQGAWTPDDRNLAEDLKKQIADLRTELGR